jgi:two-component system chemotaxis sensor kinase CheA
MDRELRQLREASERLRLVAAQNIFTALERTARDTARALSKQVAFRSSGGDIRLDAHVLETLQAALIQIIRNAVAHGIEPAEERSRAGKPAAGAIVVGITRRQRQIVISCSDDGRGIDLDAVRRAASQRGVIAADVGMPNSGDILQLLLRGGFSTAKSVTEEAGRGIGLDVVRESAKRLGGEVTCRSTPGAGATFEIAIPPSLSSLDALLVADASRSVLAVPLDAIRSTRRIAPADLTVTAEAASILHEGTAVPFLPLGAALGNPHRRDQRHWTVLMVEGSDGGLAAIGVEGLSGVARIVARPLPQDMPLHLVVAATFLDGEGNPQLVLDPDSLVRAAKDGCALAPEARSERRPVLVVDDSLTTRMLEQSILESAGYEVDLAESGEQALLRVRDRDYGLILVDVEMPGIDGFTFIERLRSDMRLRDIPAILVTSLSQPEHRKRGEEVGAQGYIVKSEFDQADLLSMIKPMMAA